MYIFIINKIYSNKIKIDTDILHLNNNIDKPRLYKYNNKSGITT